MGACRLCLASGSIVSPDGKLWMSPLEAFSQKLYDVTWKECPNCDGHGIRDVSESEQITKALEKVDGNLRK